MPESDAELRDRLAVLDDLERVGMLLGWDQETKMPPAGVAARGEHMATISRLHHERLTDPRLGELLRGANGLDERVVQTVTRDHERARRVPEELVAEIARAGADARQPWIDAREARDFALFAPALERNLTLRRRLAECFPEADHPYDALLDAYEPGMTTQQVRAVFAELRAGLVPLIAAIAQSGVEAPTLPGPFDVEAQRTLGLDMVRTWGFDDRAGWRFDLTVHPFASSISPDDVRVTGRFDPDDLGGLWAVLHEVGHGLYEHQVDPALLRTTVGTGTSLGVHESQSRLWENWVGRSRAFLEHWHPRAVELLPALADTDADTFYRAINAVRPSLIRVEADEATYALHVILRFELEVELVEGTLQVGDLAEAWNAKTKELLGLDVPHDTVGVLQDIHWSFGEFGYFPTYALGSIVAAQLWDAFTARHTFDPADVTPLREWLREHVHRHGRRLTPAEVLHGATGQSLDPQPLLRYLKRKFEPVYGLDGS